MSPPPDLEKSDSVPLRSSAMSPSAPTLNPWLLTGLVLMAMNAYFPQLSPVSSLWSPLQEVIPVLHWTASWLFVSPGWEPNLKVPKILLEEAWASLEVTKTVPEESLVEVKAAFEELYSNYFAKEGTPAQGNQIYAWDTWNLLVG
ncbi:hypothetical protein DSO57_1011571 [Entomophthora muscae]|uniref:Uncharacterized protein n=1 Tax=Entomophthora muscae TaxID=34485 RepID=A0ACC2SV27_9FUNG|nr:hypothetical protein DSO57_1011571 [Entomophthora muscae]